MATINGTPGNDILSGTDSYDRISGLAGNDQIFGGGGDDDLEGGAGDDLLDGGTGRDTARYAIMTGTVTINMVTGTVTGTDSGNDTLISIERIQTSGPGRTVFIGRDDTNDDITAFGGGANVLSGGNGDDYIFDGGAGSTLDGGSGNDTLTLARYVNTPFVHTFTPGVSGTLADGTTYSNFEVFALQTGDGDDSVTFVSPISNKTGDPISHSYWQAFGGYDTATIDLSAYSAPFMTAYYTWGSLYLYDQGSPGSKNVMTFSGVEKFIIIGGSGDDVFNGSTGNEVYTGGRGNDLLNGGADFDIARYSGLSSDYRIDPLSEQTFQITDLRAGSPDGTDTLIKIEQLQWGDGSSTSLLNTAPEVATSDRTVAAGQTLTLSSLIAVSDHEGDPITKYQLWDSIGDPNSGYFTVNGAIQAPGTVIEISAAQLPQTRFVTGSVADNLQVRAFDGHGWSTLDNESWSPFTISPPVNHPPVVWDYDFLRSQHQTIAITDLINTYDGDGDTITRYQFWDSTRDSKSGHFVVNGAIQAAGTIIDITAAQLSQASFVTGTVNDDLQVRVFDGKAWSAADNEIWSPFTVTLPPNRAPAVATTNLTIPHTQTISASSLFLANDPDGDPITRYQLWDSTGNPASGYFIVDGTAQPSGKVIDVTAAELAQTYFVTGTVGDSLQIRASDGINWSAADNASWSAFTITVPVNHAPVVTTSLIQQYHYSTIGANQLAGISDPDGDPIVRYQLWDSTSDPASGHFVVNGQIQAAGTVITLTQAQFLQTSFVTSLINDELQIRAYDGSAWSAADNAPWSPFKVMVPAYTAPALTTANMMAAANQTLPLTSLIAVDDPDGDLLTRYQLWDSTSNPNSGHWVVNGVAQPAGTVIGITSADFSQTAFVTGAVNDNLQVRVFDGTSWSAADTAAWSPFTIGPTAHAGPVVSTSGSTQYHGQAFALSVLISATAANPITRYQMRDMNPGAVNGYVMVNGAIQPAGSIIDMTAADFAQAFFVTGSPNQNTGNVAHTFQVRAFDGTEWSAADNAPWTPLTMISVSNRPPTLSPTPPPGIIGGPPNTSIDLSDMLSLISMADADNDAITRVQLWDSTADPNSGHWAINGVAQPAGKVIDLDASQIPQVSFDTGRVSDNLQIRVFDGIDWSAADNAAWGPFTFVVTNIAPVVGTSSTTAQHGRTLLPSDLFTAMDGDGDAITRYQLWDSTRDPSSGHFVVNGQVQAAGTVIDLTAAQMAQTVFVTGKVSDNLQVRAFDGLDWSAADNAPWAPFTVSVTAYTAPSLSTQDINTTPGQTLALSTLFQLSDPDGDTMMRYQLWDSTGNPNSGHFVVNGVTQAASTVIDLTPTQFAQTSFVTGTVGDALQIRAFDGISWSAADTASWAPFHVNVS